MDIERSFSYVFRDRDWPKKLLLGGLMNLPIVDFVLFPACMGYSLRVLKASAHENEPRLPEWADFGQYWVSGLLQIAALLIMLIPAIPGIIAAIIGGNWAKASNENPMLLCCFSFACIASLWMLFVGIVFPMGRAHYAQTGEFASFFRLGRILGTIGEHIGDYVVALVVIAVTKSLANLLGWVLCLLGKGFLGFYGQLVTADLIGQVASLSGQIKDSTRPSPPPSVSSMSTALAVEAEEIDTELGREVEGELGHGGPESVGATAADEDYGGPEA